MNICIKMCVLVTSCVTNHNKNVRIHHLVLVIAPLKNFKMAATENSKYLHVFHAPHILLFIEVIGVIIILVYMWICACYFMCWWLVVLQIIPNVRIPLPSLHMIRKDWEWRQTLSPYITDMVRFSRNMIQQCIKGGTDLRALMSMSTGIVLEH